MSGLRRAAGRRPVLVLTLAGVPASWAVLLLPQLAWPGRVPLPVLVLATTWLVLLPTALLVTAAADGRGAVSTLLRSVLRWPRRRAGWAVVALALALPGGTVLAALLGGGGLVRPSAGAVGTELLALGSAVLVIHLAEETVWTGVVQHRLTLRRGPLTAALITAGPFAAVHLPLLLVPGVTSAELLTGAGGLLVLAVVVRLLVATVAGRAACVLPAAVLHACFNAVANEGRLLDAVLTGADSDLLGTGTALVLAVAALAARRTAVRRRSGRRGHPDHGAGRTGGVVVPEPGDRSRVRT